MPSLMPCYEKCFNSVENYVENCIRHVLQVSTEVFYKYTYILPFFIAYNNLLFGYDSYDQLQPDTSYYCCVSQMC